MHQRTAVYALIPLLSDEAVAWNLMFMITEAEKTCLLFPRAIATDSLSNSQCVNIYPEIIQRSTAAQGKSTASVTEDAKPKHLACRGIRDQSKKYFAGSNSVKAATNSQ